MTATDIGVHTKIEVLFVIYNPRHEIDCVPTNRFLCRFVVDYDVLEFFCVLYKSIIFNSRFVVDVMITDNDVEVDVVVFKELKEALFNLLEDV